MNTQPDTCFFARTFGQNWRTTIGQSCAAVGGVLGMTVPAGAWHVVGLVLFALGNVWAGVNTRDKNVSSEQMDVAGASQPIPAPKLPPVALLLLSFAFFVAFAVEALPAADTNAPAIYIVQSASMEAHHGTDLASSGVGAITHVGADYGPWAIEGLAETPLYRTQQHTRRSIGVDALLKPWQIGSVEPYLVAGAGYYWGSDPLQCLAADVGVGCRFHVSRWVFLQLDARDAVPYDGRTLVVPARFQIVSIGIGGRY